MNETDTPETDALWEKHSGTNAELAIEAIEKCGLLERERNEAIELMQQWLDAQNRFGDGASMMNPRLTRAITAAREFLEKKSCGESSIG